MTTTALLDTLAASPLAHALGWTLAHFLWQGTLAAAVLAIALAALRGASAQARYLICCATLLAMAAGPAATFYYVQQTPARPLPQLQLVLAAPVTVSPATLPEVELRPAAPDRWRNLPALLVPLWLAGVMFFSFRLLGGWMHVERMRRAADGPVPHEWGDAVSALAARLGVRRAVRLMASTAVRVPAVIGAFRPVILMPVGVLAGFDARQVDALLAHELAHIRRHDYLVNLAQSVIETVLFYHPAVWWVSNRIRAEREHCCDDLAAAACGDTVFYARTLADLEHRRDYAPQLAAAAAGGDLLGRVRRLLEPPAPGANWPAVAVVVLLFSAVAMGIHVAVPAEEGQAAGAIVRATEPQTAPKEPPKPSPFGEPPRATSPAGDDPVDDLIALYDVEKTRQMKLAILSHLGEDPGPRAYAKLVAVAGSEKDSEVRIAALGFVAQRGGAAADDLGKLYDATPDPELKSTILGYLAEIGGSRAHQKLMAIAQSESRQELREAAVGHIAQRSQYTRSDAAIEDLIRLYDAAREAEIKRTILNHLGEAGGPRARQKLLAIAKADPDIELREAALGFIAQRRRGQHAGVLWNPVRGQELILFQNALREMELQKIKESEIQKELLKRR
jgi:beta-lactamase regulating signal transducer with metallopeptidase domain